MVLSVWMLFLAIFTIGMGRFALAALTGVTEEPVLQPGTTQGPAGSRAA